VRFADEKISMLTPAPALAPAHNLHDLSQLAIRQAMQIAVWQLVPGRPPAGHRPANFVSKAQRLRVKKVSIKPLPPFFH